jgi:hypothetical protein
VAPEAPVVPEVPLGPVASLPVKTNSCTPTAPTPALGGTVNEGLQYITLPS